MTALNLAVQPRRRAAYLITDTAYTRPDGRVDRFASKVIAFARFPAACGVSGNVSVERLGQELIAQDPRNIRRLVQVLPGCLRRAIASSAKDGTTPETDIIGMLAIAAWSSRAQKPVGYLVTSDPAVASVCGIDPWEVREAYSFQACAQPLSEIFGRACRLEDAAQFDPHQDSFSLVSGQRRLPQTIAVQGVDQTIKFRIGGGVDMAEVTRRGVRIWGCGDFPDAVGELIDPISATVPGEIDASASRRVGCGE